ncbi:MAG: hypothetical protein IJN89_05850 [Anaerotignum sp.]|nr:hypothetical protein [Anaerotignum sp.]
MKAYRKKLAGILLAMLFCFSPVSVLADELPVTISSGLDMELEEVESTFDAERIVYGEAAPGTKVIFTVSKMNRFGVMTELHRNEVKVGSLGLFSVTLPLERGNNFIDITADGKTEQVVVKRVPQAVKTQLQRMIALPGLNVVL